VPPEGELAAVPAASLPAGFEPIAPLSRARTYEVWDAWDERRACRVVVKVVRPDRRGDDAAAGRLLVEGELLERLRHPHIVRALEIVPGPEPALVMETLGGATLAHIIDEQEPLEAEEIAHLGMQLISAVAHLHCCQRLHLDLKPSNVIAEAGRARLIDLGLASPPGWIAPGLGTWSYLAPEQARGGEVGAAADVWGLGATMFDCACGFPPFDDPAHEGDGSAPGGATPAADGSRPSGSSRSGDWPGEFPQLSRRARPVAEVRPLEPRLAALIAACLEPEPELRPSLAELAAGLEEIAGLEPAERRLSRSVRG